MRYHITTYGCQMNVADSRRLAGELERLGLSPVEAAEEADVIVLNTCVVRQQPEDRAVNRLLSLRPLKEQHPGVLIALMGCLVGTRDPTGELSARFPFVDVFAPPSDPRPLVDMIIERHAKQITAESRERQVAAQDGEYLLPLSDRGRLVSAHVPIVLGCSHACSYCIIPYRRGPETSRRPADILAEASALVQQGVREITLLGQIVDRYGLDLPEQTSLSALMRELHEIEGLQRIRFLTSHPNWMTDELLDAVAELPKVCEHIEVPLQAGDDGILRAMRRGYQASEYESIIKRIRDTIPQVSISTDVIVGFPGESEVEFLKTYDLLEKLRMDKAHIARYSPRPQTLSARTMEDLVPSAEKERRRKVLDDLQAQISGEINTRLVDKSVEVLVEDYQRGRWRSRTRGNKLVFFEDSRELRGELVQVRIEWAGPWSMYGTAQ